MSRVIANGISFRSTCLSCRRSLLSGPPMARSFVSTSHQNAVDPIASLFGDAPSQSSSRTAGTLSADLSLPSTSSISLSQRPEPHRFHVYATKHNTHITLARPNSDAAISVSAGNIGFRKAGRGSYDAAYQLAAYVMGQIQEKGLLREIQDLEVVLRGFGAGREAVTKVLMGSEGRRIRDKVIRVRDSTRLKFGGTRSRKPRRLG